MANYLVVLFKDKKKKRIIKKFITLTKAKVLYKKMLESSKDIIFPTEIENGVVCKYELGIIEMSDKQLIPVYMTDEFGRSVKVKLNEDGMTLFEISPYNREETIHDNQQKKNITTSEFIKRYLKGDGLKMISSLNNRIIVQQDELTFIFTLKSESESIRFIDCLSHHFFKIKRGDCLLVKDTTMAQKKYLYNLLESKGINKRMLYRKFTSPLISSESSSLQVPKA